MRPVAATLALMVFGWALVSAADSRQETPEATVEYRVVTVQVEAETFDTPIADGLVDWVEHERQSDCLWVFLTDHFGRELTLDRVLAAGAWTDALGGACLVIGEDDE